MALIIQHFPNISTKSSLQYLKSKSRFTSVNGSQFCFNNQFKSQHFGRCESQLRKNQFGLLAPLSVMSYLVEYLINDYFL